MKKTDNIDEYVRYRLFEMQDLEYKAFHSKLMPTVNPEKIIGVRTPQLRKFAKEFAQKSDAKEFLEILPHTYYEENNLHGMLIEQIKDYDECVAYLDKFLPYVDNWATCDLISPKVFRKHLPELLKPINEWIHSPNTYTIRFGIGALMRYYLDEEFKAEYASVVAKVCSQEYYVNMMIAWYFATALAKQYEAVLPFIEENRLEVWIHNKTIQKACESYRVTQEHKIYLKTLKR